jgi:hypothetical protein
MLPALTRARGAVRDASPALRFVLMVGIMSFFADFTYEGSRSITGPYLGGMGVQESLIPAAVAPMVAAGRRASVYGLFTGIYGTAWVAGSVVIGVLVSVSVRGLVLFCAVCELAAIPLIWIVRTRSKTPTGQPVD